MQSFLQGRPEKSWPLLGLKPAPASPARLASLPNLMANRSSIIIGPRAIRHPR